MKYHIVLSLDITYIDTVSSINSDLILIKD